jgi:DHA2 family methylenomycin A resistance protein-like MFS transporter
MQRYRRHALVAAAYLGTFLATLDISIVNVALPTLQTALKTDIGGLQWVINAYAICLSAFMLSAGPFGDRYGHKKIWLGSVALFTIGSLACALAGSIELLLVGRAIQGIAGALLIPGAMPILIHAFPEPRERSRAIGGWSAFSALALILGPLLGGLLLERAGWQSIFLINVPLGVAATALGVWGIPERRHPAHAALDPIGQLLSVFWLGALTYGLIEVGEVGLANMRVLYVLGAAAVGLLAFIVVESRVAKPLFPVALFRDRRLALANVASFALGFSGYSSLFFISLLLQQGRGESPASTGWQMMPQFVLTGLVSLMFGRMVALIRVHTLMMVGYAIVGSALLLMGFVQVHTAYPIIAAAFSLLGLGMGLSVPATGLAVMGLAPAERAGMVSATMNALRQTGMSLGIAVLGSLMSLKATEDLTASARLAGVQDAAGLASMAVKRHHFPPGESVFQGLYKSAIIGGFNAAMLWAGALCVAVALLLLAQGTPRSNRRT